VDSNVNAQHIYININRKGESSTRRRWTESCKM